MLLLVLALLGRAGWSVAEKLEEEAPFCNHKHRSHPLAEQEDRRVWGMDLPPAYLQTSCVGKPHWFLGFLFHPVRCNRSLIHSPDARWAAAAACLQTSQEGAFCD